MFEAGVPQLIDQYRIRFAIVVVDLLKGEDVYLVAN
jgi:hypothetical protein